MVKSKENEVPNKKDLNIIHEGNEYMVRKYQVETGFWICFAIVLLIGLGAIPLRESISATIFILLSIVMLIFNKAIIDIIWTGIQ
ncbi:MAG: hypothetical protein ABIG95_04005 [Candidatus Woesearchaeota archaeon]